MHILVGQYKKSFSLYELNYLHQTSHVFRCDIDDILDFSPSDQFERK